MHASFVGFGLAITLCSTAMANPREVPHPGPAKPESSRVHSVPVISKNASSEQKPLRGLDSRFSALDANHDGYISRTETRADSTIAARFGALDANHDGKLSKLEFSQIVALSIVTVPFPIFGRAGGGSGSE